MGDLLFILFVWFLVMAKQGILAESETVSFADIPTSAYTTPVDCSIYIYGTVNGELKISQETAFEAKGRLYPTAKVIQRLFIIDLYT